MAGKGPGYADPGQDDLARQAPGPSLPHQAVGVRKVGRVHHQDRRGLGRTPGGRGRGQGTQVLAPEKHAPPRLQGRQVAAHPGISPGGAGFCS